ncbi:MAG: hypothetical protein IE916_04055 [Epsilonproteobacteria bacterium]|nr:hypothetical protein [Campylobacterota bacterium]
MRSRNGNPSLLLSVCAITLFSLSNLFGFEEYLISYRYVVKDAILYNESLQVSHAMLPCKGHPTLQTIDLPLAKEDSILSTIKENQEEFIEYIHRLGMQVEHQGETLQSMHTSTTILTLPTTCFKVEINEISAKITPLK